MNGLFLLAESPCFYVFSAFLPLLMVSVPGIPYVFSSCWLFFVWSGVPGYFPGTLILLISHALIILLYAPAYFNVHSIVSPLLFRKGFFFNPLVTELLGDEDHCFIVLYCLRYTCFRPLCVYLCCSCMLCHPVGGKGIVLYYLLSSLSDSSVFQMLTKYSH